MTLYCKCATCKLSPAKPNGKANGNPENVMGARVTALPANEVVVSYSSGTFAHLTSTEIAEISANHRGRQVCISGYISPRDQLSTKALKSLGIGGSVENDLTAEFGNMEIYYKNAGAVNGMIKEIVIVIGCGGYVSATGVNIQQTYAGGHGCCVMQ